MKKKIYYVISTVYRGGLAYSNNASVARTSQRQTDIGLDGSKRLAP